MDGGGNVSYCCARLLRLRAKTYKFKFAKVIGECALGSVLRCQREYTRMPLRAHAKSIDAIIRLIDADRDR